jgi:hypothetical protein
VNPNSLFANGAPFDSVIEIRPGIATASPETLAHEFGHILTWRSLDLPIAIMDPPVDYSCFLGDPGTGESTDLTWSQHQRECEKAAFMEGFADFHASLWMWLRTAVPTQCPGDQPRIPRGIDVYPLENLGVCNNGTGDTHNFPLCVTRALWDVVDSHANDGDGIDMSNGDLDLSDMVGAFRAYPRCAYSCWFTGNRCNTEGWPWEPSCPVDTHGNNWKDFKFQLDSQHAGLVDELDFIEDQNGLSDQTDN